MRIFEVDHPASQACKRECLAARRIPLPRNLRYIGVDFENDSLERRLAANGFDAQRQAFFSWPGVVQFLTAPAIEDALCSVARLPRGSALTPSFIVPDECLVGEHLALARYSVETCAARREPWLSRHRPDELCTIAHRAGFSAAGPLAPEAAAERSFPGWKDGLRAPRHEQLLTARV
jgi:methyltransferase (TIGR00027 family)